MLLFSCSVVSDSFVTLWIVAHQAPLWDFPGKNTGVGCHFFLQATYVHLNLNLNYAIKNKVN